MAWKISAWLALTRSFQLMGALASTALHGFVTIWIYTKQDIVLSQKVINLELLAGIVFVYSAIAIAVLHTGKRSKSTPWLLTFVFFDVLFTGVALGIISLLATSGVPEHCAGLTKYVDDPAPYWTTFGFSDEEQGKGHLDRFCGLERSYFFIAHALVFTYMITIVLAVIRVVEQKYAKLAKHDDDDVNLKVLEEQSQLSNSPRVDLPPPPSEGIITRTASLRSTFTAATSSTSTQAGPSQASYNPRRPIGFGQPPNLQPRRPPPNAGPSGRFTPVPLDEEGDLAEAALVSDGMRPHHHRQHSRDHHQQPHHLPRMPMLLEEDQLQTSDADHALVSDGMRPLEPMLPPYEPGSSRMQGHSEEEANDMRLSGYTKGQRT